MADHIHPVPREWGRVLIDDGLATCGMRGMPRDYWPADRPAADVRDNATSPVGSRTVLDDDFVFDLEA